MRRDHRSRLHLLLSFLLAGLLGASRPSGASPTDWNLLTPEGGPAPRASHTAVWDPVHHRMIVFGGNDGVSIFMNDAWSLSLVGPLEWTNLTPASGSMPSPRSNMSAIYDPAQDAVWIFGGTDGTQNLNDTWRLSLAGTPTWTHVIPGGVLPPARRSHTAILDEANRRMIVFGGYDYRNDVWALSLDGTPTWTQLSPTGARPSARQGHVALYDAGSQRMVVFGGDDGSGYLNDTWALSFGGTPAWTRISPSGTRPAGRRFLGAALDPMGRTMTLFGGQGAGGLLDDTWSLSLAGSPAWTDVSPDSGSPSPRWETAMIFDAANSRWILHGGLDGAPQVLGDVWGKTANYFPPEQCVITVDPCAAGRPKYTDHSYALGWNEGVIAATSWAASGSDPVVDVYDLGGPAPGYDQNWPAPSFHGPGWVRDTLGAVFGITLDRLGNLYVTHTAAYSAHGNPGFRSDYLGKGGAGAVYKIDRLTAGVSVFAQLPNFLPPFSGPCSPQQSIPGNVHPLDYFPGLGNICFDAAHNQFFVSNFEDGKIYRLNMNGAQIAQAYQPPFNVDHLAPCLGAVKIGDLVWGVQVHAGELYYSRWRQDEDHKYGPGQPNEIWSVKLDASGSPILGPNSEQLRLAMPLQNWYDSSSPPNLIGNFSSPVSDIAFTRDGTLLLAERSMENFTTASAHHSRVLEAECQSGAWVIPSLTKYVGGVTYPNSCAGGVAPDYSQSFGGPAAGRWWATYDALHCCSNDLIYGLEALPSTGGGHWDSFMIDLDNITTTFAKQLVGDCVIPCAADTGSISGLKFIDADRNAERRIEEPTVHGWPIHLSGPDGYDATVATDSSGSYRFSNLAAGLYTASEIGRPGWIQTGPQGDPFGTYIVDLSDLGVLVNADFANDTCSSDTMCVSPPAYMVAWWPFDEPAGSPTVRDICHLSPLRNAGALGSSGNIIPGYVGNALQCGTGSYPAVVATYDPALNLGLAPFTIDAWLYAPLDNTVRMIVDKHGGFGASFQGYRLYLENMTLRLEIGDGTSGSVIVPGPIIPQSQWTHVAVSVRYQSGGVHFYINGSLQSSATPPTLVYPGLSSGGSLVIGNASGEPPAKGFNGLIDELEIYRTELAPQSIHDLWAAGTHGKCKEFCRIASVVDFCKGDATEATDVTLCNDTPYTHHYFWTLAPSPAGSGCSVAGPTGFTPSSGSITLGPSECKSFAVTVQRPVGLTGTGTACFELSFARESTDCTRRCRGVLQSDTSWTCAHAIAGPGPFNVLGGGSTIHFDFSNACPFDLERPFRILGVTSGGSTLNPVPDPVIAVGNSPPGVPYEGTVHISPNGHVDVAVPVRFDGYQPFVMGELLVQYDIDGDGKYETVTGQPLASVLDSSAASDVPRIPPVAQAPWLSASPNPFAAGLAVRFSLPAAASIGLDVLDLGGRVIRTLHRGRLALGPHALEWDGRTDAGQPAPQGIYFIRLHGAGIDLRAKVVHLR